jgi:hypothetical protein
VRGDHAVISDDLILEELIEKLERTTYRERDTGLIIRTEDFLLNRQKDTILAKVVVVEGRAQSFYIVMNKKEGELTMRIDPTTDPEKTEGVETALALVRKQVIKTDPDSLAIVRTNIGRALQKLF